MTAMQTRWPTIEDSALCPCGSGVGFGRCCAPIIRGGWAATAESLMRSRYTAFVIGDADHLLRTWHPSRRPRTLDLSPAREWRRLRILETVAGSESDAQGEVLFVAHFREPDGSRDQLRERSRFVRAAGEWRYLDAM